jgi:hypothetical protein
MDEGARRIRSQLSRLRQGKRPSAVRYPLAVRREVLAVARRRRARGTGIARIAREVGLAPWTLALWLRKQPRAGLRVVDITPDPAPVASAPPGTGPVLITPQGIRVEGADVGALAALLRALR